MASDFEEMVAIAGHLDGALREKFFRMVCQDDADLLTRVRQHMSTTGCNGRVDRLLAGIQAGSTLDAYRLESKLGEGGMGSVFLATHTGTGQKCAVKLLSLQHADNQELLLRFKREQEVLASLDHPNIAKIYDGGIFQDHLHYLVLEYVDGLHINQATAEMSLSDLIRMFVKLTRAVASAHHKLVVHRDIKPANIMVDRHGEPKLLDFGIAGLLEAGEQTAHLKTKADLMSVAYASPEQFKRQQLSVQTDIYSLGMILFEALTGGRRPYATSFDDVAKACEEGVTKAPGDVAPKRADQLRGDLDNIVLKALAHDPAQRYATADNLADDLEAYLNGYPVKARKPTPAYRSIKFIRRNPWPVASAMVILLLMVIAGAMLANQQQQTRAALISAKYEAELSREMTDFMISLFEVADPSHPREKELNVVTLLERGVARIQNLPDEVNRARLADCMTQVHLKMGRLDEALRLNELAVQFYRNENQPVRLANSLLAQATVYRGKADFEAALERCAQIEQELRRSSGGHDALFCRSLLEKGFILMELGDYSEARQAFRQTHDRAFEVWPKGSEVSAETLGHLGELSLLEGRPDEAVSLLRESLAALRQFSGEESAAVANALFRLGVGLILKGEWEEAESVNRESLAMKRRLFGEEHIEVVHSLNSLGRILFRKGDLDQAEDVLRHGVALLTKLYGNTYLDLGLVMNSLSLVLQDKGDYKEAETLSHQTLDILRKNLGEEHPMVATGMGNHGRLLALMEDYDGAEILSRKSLAMKRKLLGDEHVEVAFLLGQLGEIQQKRALFKEAESLFRESLDMLRKALDSGHPRIVEGMFRLARTLEIKGAYEEAEPLYRESLDLMRNHFGEEHPKTAAGRVGLASLLYRTDRSQEAEPFVGEAFKVFVQQPKIAPRLFDLLFELGKDLTERKEYRQAESILLELYRKEEGKGERRSRKAREVAEALLRLYQLNGNTEQRKVFERLSAEP